MHRTWRVLAGVVALVAAVATPAGAAPVPFTGDRSLPVTRLTTTVVDTSRPTRCPAQGVDLPHRTLHVRVAFPSTGRRHPVLVFAHGMQGDPELMVDELDGWARKGYVAIAPRFPLSGRFARHGWDCGWDDIPNTNADLRFVLDQLQARRGDLATIPAGRADLSTVGASGISSGGAAVFLFYNRCCADPRVQAVDIQLAAPILVPGGWRFAELTMPLAMVHEREDPTIPMAFARDAWDAALGPKYLVTLPGGDPHSSSLPRKDTPTDVWALRERLFDFHLRGDAAAGEQLVHAFDDVPPQYTYEVARPLDRRHLGSRP